MKLSTYTVYAPADQAPENLVFVKEGFSWFAFLLPLIWLLMRRAWRSSLIYFALTIVLSTLAAAFGLDPSVLIAPTLLANLFIGLEAAALHQAALNRRGFHHIASVQGTSQTEAERHYFSNLAPRLALVTG